MALFGKKRRRGLNKKINAAPAPFKASSRWAVFQKLNAVLNNPGNRINLIVGFFALLWLVLWARAWQLQMMEGPRLAERARRQHMASELVSGKRGMILDRNGQTLARSVEAKSVYANPMEVDDVDAAALALSPILNVPTQKLRYELSKSSRRFVWLKRKIDDNAAKAVRAANLSGVGLTREYGRFYPFKHLAGQLLGFVGMDDKGLEGIERSLDPILGSMPVLQIVQRDAMGRKFYLNEEGRAQAVGEDVTLTLDSRIQFIAEEAMERVAKEFEARWSGALVIDAPTGEILAWAQYPFFNPNSYAEHSPAVYRNRLAADALEPGSTFKPFVMAAALQEKKITPNTLINCEGGKWEFKNFTIRDTSSQGILPASKVLRYSSNIGMAKIGQSLGARPFHKYLSDLGFGESNLIPVSNSRGILRQPKDWGEFDVMAAAFGQSVSVTALQMAQAYLTLLNGGERKPLKLIKAAGGVEEMPRRVFNAECAAQVLDMMRDVVEENDGTGKRARLPGIEVAGKTGTAQKADIRSKSYGSKRLASFVGIFPAKKPQYLILVFVDEPARNQYGGIVAAPAFREIALSIAAQTGSVAARAPVQEDSSRKKRRFKLSTAPAIPWLGDGGDEKLTLEQAPSMRLPGHLAKAPENVPDVKGKSVRNAVELFARAGIVPELKGAGNRVLRQFPPPGSPWPERSKNVSCILWLSER